MAKLHMSFKDEDWEKDLLEVAGDEFDEDRKWLDDDDDDEMEDGFGLFDEDEEDY